MLRGFATISFWADDVKAAREWYATLLDLRPYFERPSSESPAYVEFRLRDYEHELGIIDRKYLPKTAQPGTGGAIAYWQVDDLEGALRRALAMGAREYEPLTPRGPGFVTASVVDPFGNVLGLMSNAHYVKILEGGQSRDAGAVPPAGAGR